jgi:hypothetical protein
VQVRGIAALGRFRERNVRFIGQLKIEPSDEKLNHFKEATRPGRQKGSLLARQTHSQKGNMMTKPIHPRVVGPDGKPKRIRRTKAQIAIARAEAEHAKMLDEMTAGIEARLALATPQQNQVRRTDNRLLGEAGAKVLTMIRVETITPVANTKPVANAVANMAKRKASRVPAQAHGGSASAREGVTIALVCLADAINRRLSRSGFETRFRRRKVGK